MLVFSEYFAYVLNGWFPSEKLQCVVRQKTPLFSRDNASVCKNFLLKSFVRKVSINLIRNASLFKLTRAYSRPILRLTIERCSLLRKLCKALFWCKSLKKRLNRGSEIFGTLFSKNVPFFHKKVPFLANIALNFYNMSRPQLNDWLLCKTWNSHI